MTAHTQPSSLVTCDSPGLMPIERALETMLSSIKGLQQTEAVDLMEAHGRVLAQDIHSKINVPPADNSAMDGFALRSQDLLNTDQLELIGTALAGQPFTGKLEKGQCIRIMTGAVIPKGADAVVMQENTLSNGASITFKQIPQPSNSIRRAGEDIAQGSAVFPKGRRLKPSDLALVASIGIAQVKVIRALRVALIATGDELTTPGKTLAEGGIYESNRYALRALLNNLGVEVQDFGIIPDCKEALRQAFADADQSCDLVLSCGGVSVGEADFVKDILAEQGQINFWKVAIKPGKPFAFGKLKQAWFCGLPGNPVSSYVTFEQLVLPLLRKLSGEKTVSSTRQYFEACAASAIRKRPGRADFQRGIYYRDEHGKLMVKTNGKQGSGIMSSIAHANCYILLEQDNADIAQGESVKIQPFELVGK